MRRRQLLETLAGGVALAARAGAVPAAFPFPEPAAANRWTKIGAEGMAAAVPALVFEGNVVEGGLPLGALGTGYVTLEGNGKLGYSSLFNELVPPRKIFADWLWVESGSRRIPLSAARIRYWGHYPVADLRVDFPDLPLQMGLRAFIPFVPGDAAVSNTPAILFEIELRNSSDRALPVVLSMKWPEPPAGASLVVRGQGVTENGAAKSGWAVNTEVPARGARRVRFAAGWYAPTWRDSGNELHRNRYTQRFGSAAEVADFALGRHDELLRRVLAWQGEIYRADLPEWLRDALVQCCYSFAKNSVWIARSRKDEWWHENGWFVHNESHRGCPIVETMVCRIHGHIPLLVFFPELEEITLDAFRHFQISDGEIPFAFGMRSSLRDPRYHCQHPLNSGQYAQTVYRLHARTGDRRQLERFYDSARRAIRYQYTLDDDNCGLVHEQAHVRPGEDWPANQFYDVWPWQGVSSYVAGTWLATLAAGRAMAGAMGDREFAAECSGRLDRARRAYESRLWNGSYYRLWSDSERRTTSEICLANQLMAQWCCRVAGLPDVLLPAHVAAALDAIERLNMGATTHGLINGVTPDGKPFDTLLHPKGDHSKNIFVGENLCAAMTFLYHGRKDTGLEIARRMYEAMAVKTRSPWNQRCLLDGQTGLPVWGDDYYSNMVIWAVPMALAGQSIGEFARGGLVGRMLRAGA